MPTMFPFQASDTQLRLELDQGWEFLADPTAKLTLENLSEVSGWRPARAGLSWNVQFDDLRDYMGAAWYRTRFEVPFTRNVHHVLLKFGAVDYFCEIFVNGTRVGSHEGGYTPFSFDLSNEVRAGENELVLRVVDPPMDEKKNQELFPDMLYNEIPHGKQNWYVQNSGIWQGVRIEFTPMIYVDRVDVTPQMNGDFRVDIKLEGSGLEGHPDLFSRTEIYAVAYDNAGITVWETTSKLPESELLQLQGKVHDPKFWEPEQPELYTVDVVLQGAVQYRRRTRFGFRELRAMNGQLVLNGRPFYMIAALDQDFYPETIHTPASENFVREMMCKAKHLGINVLRCHLKVAHPVYLDVANEVGMLVWAELPSWSDCWFASDHFSRKAAERVERMFEEMMLRDWNHPCLVIQTIMNESWGINLQDAQQRAWLKATFDKMKGVLEPLGRLVIDNSPCEGNFHLKSDIEDFHNYYSQPDQAPLWDDFVRTFASRPDWTYSPFGDEERTRREPLVVSEFGNWGLPQLPKELPWWFSQSFGSREVTRPAGVLERFHEFQFDRVFTDFNDLASETQWHQFASLKYEIESMRRQPSIQGYCVTGMTDVHWEVNGLLDMWRNEKVFAEDLGRLQQSDLIMASLPASNFFCGQEFTFAALLSHFSQRDTKGMILRWSLERGESGSSVIAHSVLTGEVEQLCELTVAAPPCDLPTRVNLRVELRSPSGALIAENNYSLFVFPRSARPSIGPVFFHDPLGTSAATLAGLRDAGWEIEDLAHVTELPRGAVILSSILDLKIMGHLHAGTRALILANSEQAFCDEVSITCVPRTDNWLDGRWFSNFNWIQPKSPPYQTLAFSPILGFESRYVVPEYVIGNVAGEHFGAAIASITVGWLQLNHPLALQATMGAGRALITTFRFDHYGRDPYSTHLLNAYFSHVAQGDWEGRRALSMQDTIRGDAV